MQGDKKIIDYLNSTLRAELTAINQYWLHYRIFENQGFLELAKKWRDESMEEMRHSDRLVKRVLFLDGFPNLQDLDPLRIGQTVNEIITADLTTEIETRKLFVEAAVYCDSIDERVSMDLFEEIIKSSERQIDFLETQQELISQLGVQLYSQKHVGNLS